MNFLDSISGINYCSVNLVFKKIYIFKGKKWTMTIHSEKQKQMKSGIVL